MQILRRAILAFSLIAGLAPAFAQAPAPVPALPDTERRTSYSITSSNCACSVGFALYGDSTDYQNWVEVWLNGVRVNYNDATFGWTITSASGPLGNIALPITNAVLTFTNPQTGTVQIVGARRPRRVSQFPENRGVAARDLNQAMTDQVAMLREMWDRTNDVTGRAILALPGEILSPLPAAASRAGGFLCWDGTGLIPLTCSPQSGTGNMSGPNTSVNADLPCFNGTSGKLLSDCGALGGDISGPVASVTVAKVQGLAYKSAATYANGQSPTWNSSNSDFEPGSGSSAIPAPGGRLTLVSGQAEMSADVTSQNLYYAPDEGNTVPIYNGTIWTPYQFTSSTTDQVGLTLALGGSANWPAATIFDVFAVNNGGTIQLATRAWDSSMLPTTTQISNNTNTVITTGTGGGTTWSNTANAFNGTLVQSSATAAVSSPGVANLNNCIGQDLGVSITKVLTKVALTEPTDTSFRGDNPTTMIVSTYGSNDNTNWQRLDASRNILSTAPTLGSTYTYFINANDATPYRYFRVCFTGNGTNAVRVAQVQFFTTNAPSTRRLTRFNGIPVNDATITARISSSSTISVPANQATYLGSIQTDAATAGQVTANFGYGINRVMNIWNYYHRKAVTLVAGIPALNSAAPASATFNYTLTWPAWQDWQGVQSSTSYSAEVLVGYVGDNVKASFSRSWYLNGTGGSTAAYECGIGIDTTITFSGSECGTTGDGIGTTEIGYFGTSNVTVPQFFGTHTLFGIERLTYAPTGTVQAFENVGNTGLYVSTTY